MKNDYFKKYINLVKLARLNQRLNLNDRHYYLSIKKFNPNFLYEIVNKIYYLQMKYQQPFLLNKSSIRSIFKYFLPYTFFLCLSREEAIKLKMELKDNENFDFFVVIKKREEKGISIFTYTDNFFEFGIDFYNEKNQDMVVDFFKFYKRFFDDNFYRETAFNQEKVKDLYGNFPVVLFENLNLDEAILILYYFFEKFPKLPIQLMMTETSVLMKKKKVKWI